MLLHLLADFLVPLALFFLEFLLFLCIKDEIVINLVIKCGLLVYNIVHLFVKRAISAGVCRYH